MGDHSSGTALADRLTRPTRTECEGAPAHKVGARPYSVLLQAGLAVPALSPGPRWALTPPFHPCLRTNAKVVYFLWRYPSGCTPLERFPGRTLSAALPPWSPDFPPEEIAPRQRSPGRLIDHSD